MKTTPPTLSKAIQRLSFALPLFFIGPIVIHNAFMNRDNIWHYLVLTFGIMFCGLGMFFMYQGLSIMMKVLFKDPN